MRDKNHTNQIISLFRLYSPNDKENEEILATGNPEQIFSMLRKASVMEPERFIPFFEKIVVSDEIPNKYAGAMMEGIILNLLYRSDADDSPKRKTLADSEQVMKFILNWLEQHSFLWEKTSFIADLLKKCSHYLNDSDSFTRFIFCQYRLAGDADPESPKNKENLNEKDLEEFSQYSIRGKAAEGSILFAINLLEKKYTVPALLSPLLFRFTTDTHPGVRVSILKHLSGLAQYEPKLAWKLFRSAFQYPIPALWASGECLLSHQCDKDFEAVKYYLTRIKNEVFERAGDVWGKVSMLACLSDHTSQDILFKELVSLNNTQVWQGVVSAFKLKIMQAENTECAILLANQFIRIASYTPDLQWFESWLSDLSLYAPRSALQLYENLFSEINHPKFMSKILEIEERLDIR